MSDQTRPNLFHYATSELSQDAFICWLAAWADPMYKDDDLHQAGSDFIRSMLAKKKGCDVEVIKAVKVRRQVGKIDVLIEINKNPDADESTPGELAILIEDKTHTFDHSEQLERYHKQVIESGYADNRVVPLYFKTYLREDFLAVLIKARERVKNAIYHDFLAHLENMETAIQQFRTKDSVDWKDNDWRGFFLELYPHKKLYGANWGHVNNRSGGFMGFWWDEKSNSNPAYKAYLQLETLYRNSNDPHAKCELCFKIAVAEKTNAGIAWHDAYKKLWQSSQQLNMPIKKAKITQNAWTVTVARWAGDYRVFNNGTLDMTATLENLKKAQMLLDAAFGT